jgi:hypothetical protein
MIYWATQNIHTHVVTVSRETYTWVNAVPGVGGGAAEKLWLAYISPFGIH